MSRRNGPRGGEYARKVTRAPFASAKQEESEVIVSMSNPKVAMCAGCGERIPAMQGTVEGPKGSEVVFHPRCRNVAPGKCESCGDAVASQEGLRRDVGGKTWRIFHIACLAPEPKRIKIKEPDAFPTAAQLRYLHELVTEYDVAIDFPTRQQVSDLIGGIVGEYGHLTKRPAEKRKKKPDSKSSGSRKTTKASREGPPTGLNSEGFNREAPCGECYDLAEHRTGYCKTESQPRIKNPDAPPSDAQLRYLRHLAAQHKVKCPDVATMAEASRAISELTNA